VKIANSEEVDVVTTEYEIPRENVIRYIATGNYKWSTFEVDTRNLDNPTLNLEVMIDGSLAYQLKIAGKPVKLYQSTALAAFVPQSFSKLIHKMGMRPSKWF